ncbi:glycosyltransferase [Moheibacter sediminis]|uniref:Glycosyltransferase involved in cell wall bisynthesis n=1 Tax=Moheibacter sediminis TaxID=1434700 RepID=A0A1W2AL73_9FLAO|nr:glycosyltransferase [Moheibacter sediminis]SMC61447.1 Glycosyltransferase involved in cell wall bisynthesis [Moheibacter sediminis]
MLSKTKTIVFILPDLGQGGAERVITTIINHLDRNKYTPKLILFEKKGFYLNDLAKDVEIIELNVSRIRYSIFKIIPTLKKIKPDFVFIGWGEISAFISPLIPFFRKTKFIARETNVVSQHVKRKEIRFFYRFYNNFHKIIAQSDDMKNDLVKNIGIKSEKIVKINNPVDFELIESRLNSKEKHYSGEFKNVVAIGNLSERKGFDLLLKVFDKLKETNIKLHILGDGLQKEELLKQKENSNLKNVEFLGIKENPFPYLQQADLFILSSRYEGFPNVLLEAGACGTYALANDCPGGIGEIIQNEVNGEICDINDSERFSLKISELVNQTHPQEIIKESIRSRFAKGVILDKYNKIFEDL